MRTLILLELFGMISVCNVAYCQTSVINNGTPKHQPPQVLSAQQLTTERIRHMISSKVPLETFTVPLLFRMGDGAAREAIQILKTRGPLIPTEQQNVVQMMHKAFEMPAAIMHISDRTPTSTLALLGQLSVSTQDPGLQSQIADVQQFVLAATAAK